MTQALPPACEAALRNGEPDHALQLAIDLLHRNKDDLSALAACYEAYRLKQDRANAAKVLEVMLRIDSDHGFALGEAGLARLEQGRLDEAEPLLRRAVERGAASARVHEGFGRVLSEANRLSAGEWHFRRAIDLDEARADSWLQLGLNLARQERGEAASDCYETARRLAPSSLDPLAWHAKHLEVTGALDAAAALLDEADRSHPGETKLLRANLLARQGRGTEALEFLERQQSLNGDGLLERGRLKDRLGDHEGAWRDLVDAKRKLAEEAGGLRYQREGVEDFFRSMAETFDTSLMSEIPRASKRMDRPAPLFIMGAPRSGTTLLERVLAAHPHISAGGELPFVADWRLLTEQAIPGRRFPENMTALRAADLQPLVAAMRDAYLARRDARGGIDASTQFVTDKMPFNEIYLPLVRLAFPESPIVLLSRDPRDVTVSMLCNKLNHGFHCAYRVEDTVHHLRAVSQLVDAYGASFEMNVHRLAYETLTEAPEASVRAMLDDIGLAFDDACLSFQRQGHYVATPSYDQVDQPINRRATGRHRNYARQLAPFFTDWDSPKRSR
ncbi:MAG: sulfotransferase [Pseudomonadota bacterium]